MFNTHTFSCMIVFGLCKFEHKGKSKYIEKVHYNDVLAVSQGRYLLMGIKTSYVYIIK